MNNYISYVDEGWKTIYQSKGKGRGKQTKIHLRPKKVTTHLSGKKDEWAAKKQAYGVAA